MGGLSGVAVMSWISLNAQWALASGAMSFEHKPMHVDACPAEYNLTTIDTSFVSEQKE